MKKLLPLVVVLVVVGGVWLFSSARRDAPAPSIPTATTNGPSEPGGLSMDGSGAPGMSTNATSGNPADGGVTLPAEGLDEAPAAKPAAESYASAEEAMAAVLKAAKDYDDTVLEQFTQPGPDCSWCPEFYRSVKDTLNAAGTPQDQKSFLAEILAISGRAENVQTLIDQIKNAKNSEEADLYSEALELTVGKDDVTRLLGEQLNSTNETLRESSVAAVTNQGSRMAAELIIKHTQERGDPDGYYSLGIGLGEFIPDEEAMPLLQEMVQKRDQYSHLAVKSLINSGMDGLRAVFDELETSNDPETDRRLLKDAIDHVNFEEGLDQYLKQKLENSQQPVVREFAQRILDEYTGTEEGGPQPIVE